jgi:hypothetical protein
MCRIALLVKLRLYSTAQEELEAFGDFDRPDLYFDYHADIYPEHKGGSINLKCILFLFHYLVSLYRKFGTIFTSIASC